MKGYVTRNDNIGGIAGWGDCPQRQTIAMLNENGMLSMGNCSVFFFLFFFSFCLLRGNLLCFWGFNNFLLYLGECYPHS